MAGIDEEGLSAVVERGSIFADETIDVVATGPDGDRSVRRGNGESGVVDGATVWTDDVDGFGLAQVIIDGGLLVGIGVECDSALLLEDGGVVLLRTETDTTEIASHGRFS